MTSSSSPPPPDAAARRYGTVARLFHWGTAVLVLLMIPAGVAMTSNGFEAISDQLFILHKGTGVLLLVLVVLRILWRITHAPPPPAPGMSATRARLADWTHSFLYLLLLVMTVSGYMRVVGGGYPLELLDRLGVPPLLPEMETVSERASVVHKLTAYLFTAVISAHITAAVLDGLDRRSEAGLGILGRMWPPVGGDR